MQFCTTYSIPQIRYRAKSNNLRSPKSVSTVVILLSGRKGWAIRSSARTFAHRAQLFACFALLASLARPPLLLRSLARSLTRSWDSETFNVPFSNSEPYGCGTRIWLDWYKPSLCCLLLFHSRLFFFVSIHKTFLGGKVFSAFCLTDFLFHFSRSYFFFFFFSISFAIMFVLFFVLNVKRRL